MWASYNFYVGFEFPHHSGFSWQPESPANILGSTQNIEIQNTKCSAPSIGRTNQ